MPNEQWQNSNKKFHKMSITRKIYIGKFISRCVLALIVFFLYFFKPVSFEVIKGLNFFDSFSFFHILWLIWIGDMIVQLLPVKAYVSIGSQKHFFNMYKPTSERYNHKDLKSYLSNATKKAYLIFWLWVFVIAVIGILYKLNIINDAFIVCITMFFYVCDLVCVLIWCPFRLILHNRCCTTCRIFNWDHLMMFSPLIFICGFYTWTLVAMSITIWLAWELCVIFHPERFWDKTNDALKCSNCTDKVCVQYCQKTK